MDGFTTQIAGLSQIAEGYDALFCDVWGVIHDGRRAFPGACDALRRFRQKGGAVVLITNAPVPKDRVIAVFPRVGAPEDIFDDVIPSGETTRQELIRRAPGPVYRIGIAEDMSVYEGTGVRFAETIGEAQVVCCTGLRDFVTGVPDDYRDELEQLALAGLEMICANPDVQFRFGDRLIWSAGALAELYEAVGGRVIRPGKPDPAIYSLARERLRALRGAAVPDGRILAVGDGPATDIRGANNEGIDALFVGSGIHGDIVRGNEGFLSSAISLLESEKVKARFVMPELNW
jgi:HAD superfamily hydrolase (TIGR01459 family)